MRRLYKVRAWVNKWDRKGGYSHPFRHEEVFLKLKAAKRVFDVCVNEVKTWQGLPGIKSVRVTLFIPHVFEDGSLAYWPDDEKYIKQYNPNNL